MRRIISAAVALLAMTLVSCSTDDGGNASADKPSSSAFEHVPADPAEPTISSPPAPLANEALIASAKACVVVTKKMLEAAVADSLFMLAGESDSPDPAYKYYEQRCQYVGQIDGQFNDNPFTSGSAVTIDVRTLIDDEAGTQWTAMKTVALRSGTDVSKGNNEAVADEGSAVGRKAGGRVIVQVYSTNNTDGAVTPGEFVAIIQKVLDGLTAN